MKTFDFDQKVFRSFGKKFQQSYQNCILRVQVKIRGESFRKFITVFHFFIDGQKNLNFRWKLFHSLSKLYLTCGRQQLEKKYVPLIYRNITLFGVSVKIFPRGSSKLHFICSQPTYEHLINFWWKIYIYKFFGMWAKTNQTVWKKSSGRLTGEHASCAKEAFSLTYFFWKECFFLKEEWEFELKNINFLMEITGSLRQNSFLSVHGNI